MRPRGWIENIRESHSHRVQRSGHHQLRCVMAKEKSLLFADSDPGARPPCQVGIVDRSGRPAPRIAWKLGRGGQGVSRMASSTRSALLGVPMVQGRPSRFKTRFHRRCAAFDILRRTSPSQHLSPSGLVCFLRRSSLLHQFKSIVTSPSCSLSGTGRHRSFPISSNKFASPLSSEHQVGLLVVVRAS
jgi:hypothetical protein